MSRFRLRGRRWRLPLAAGSKYPACEALDPRFEIMMKGLSKYVDGEHYFDTLADDVVFEFLYEFPGHAKRAAVKISLPSIPGTDATSDPTEGIHCSCILPTMGGW